MRGGVCLGVWLPLLLSLCVSVPFLIVPVPVLVPVPSIALVSGSVLVIGVSLTLSLFLYLCLLLRLRLSLSGFLCLVLASRSFLDAATHRNVATPAALVAKVPPSLLAVAF